jgi:hypothetical protein
MDKYTKNTVHYYAEDGDIILQVEDTHFLVHKTFLSFASEFFKSLFACATPSPNEIIKITKDSSKESSIPVFEIIDEKSNLIEDMLSFIYPNTVLNVGWDNVENLLRLSDKFIIKKLVNSCVIFLQDHFTEKILTAFILADKYLLPTIFKETSKLILDDIIKYECDSDFKLISKRTQERLAHAHHIYYLELNKFYKLCSAKEYFSFICTFPIPKPSILQNNFINTLNSISSYDIYIKQQEYTQNFKEYLGKFEQLIKGPENMGNYCYLFIELE